MKEKIKILHLEDLESDSELINMQLNNSDISFENLVVDTKAEFIDALQHFTPDVILADHSVHSFDSMEALQLAKKINKDIPFLLVTTAMPQESINRIIKEGAKDYILKDNLDTLPQKIKNALDKVFLEKKGYPEVEVILPEEEKLYDLKMLEEMDDDDYLAEIVSIFLQETPAEFKELQAAAKARKTSIVAQKAHKLKSSTGIIEAQKLTKMLKQIEETAKSGGDPDQLPALVEAANNIYKKIETSLQNRLKQIAR